MNGGSRCLLLATGLLIAAVSQAELLRVGPNEVPSPPGHGYPLWYQDTNGVALDLCVPQTLNQLDPCLATPAPGDPPPTLPYSFPNNWSDEFFWYGAEALMDIGGGNKALLVQAVEAAFALGPPSAGDQIAFARIRIRFDAPVDGTYTVTYPYGVETFQNIAAGELIFYTSDVGIGAPGDFSGALGGQIGPFLWAVDNLGNNKPYFDIDGDTFLADPLSETQVAGSPFDTNYFEICVNNPEGRGMDGLIGTNNCRITDGFALIGKVHMEPIASPLNVTRATYTTHGDPLNTMAHIDVYANAEAGPNAAQPDLTVGIINEPSVAMIGPAAPGGRYYGQSVVDETMVPVTVTVINSGDTPPSSVVTPLVDEITITDATYDPTNSILSITAKSSDEIGSPALSVIGVPGIVDGSDPLSVMPLTGIGTVNLPLTSSMPPPRSVTVVSAAGGSTTIAVTIPAHSGVFLTGAPLAVDDFVFTGENTTATFAVLANDGAEAVASMVSLIKIPINGTATVNTLDGSVDYTPNAGYFGNDSFTYTVDNAAGQGSNVSTVSITVVQLNDAPVANPDTWAFPAGQGSIIVDVTANDTDADGIAPAPGGLDPASVAIGSVTTGSSAISNSDGTVTFTIGTCTVACGFLYTVSDLGSLTSNVAAVTITTGGNILPTANPDAASVNVEQSVNIVVAANDSDTDGTLDLTSVVIASPATGGNAISNGDGTVTYTAPATAGMYTFGYTIADNLGGVSGLAVVTVTVNAAPDTLGVGRAQCRTRKDEWRVDGTSSILTPHSVSVFAGSTVAGGTLIAANLAVDNFGEWKMSKKNVSAACVPIISIESSLGGKLEGVNVNVN